MVVARVATAAAVACGIFATIALLPAAAEATLTPVDPHLNELSGIAADPDNRGFWVHQDAGHDPDVYLIGRSGETALTVRPVGALTEDPEDIAVGPSGQGPATSLYLSDAGDAYRIRKDAGREPRTQFQIVRLGIPSTDTVNAAGSVALPSETLKFEYPDHRNRNSEATLVDPVDGSIWVINKVPTGVKADVWNIRGAFGAASIVNAVQVGQLDIAQVSGAAVDPTRRFAVLRNGEKAYLYRVTSGQTLGDALKGDPTVIDLPSQPQGEGVTVANSGDALVIDSEHARQPFQVVALPTAFVAALPSPSTAARHDPQPRSLLPMMLGAGIVIAALALIGVSAARSRRRARQRS